MTTTYLQRESLTTKILGWVLLFWTFPTILFIIMPVTNKLAEIYPDVVSRGTWVLVWIGGEILLLVLYWGSRIVDHRRRSKVEPSAWLILQVLHTIRESPLVEDSAFVHELVAAVHAKYYPTTAIADWQTINTFTRHRQLLNAPLSLTPARKEEIRRLLLSSD